MSSWDQANRGEKLVLVWRNRKKLAKLSMTTFAYRSSSYLFYELEPRQKRRTVNLWKVKPLSYFTFNYSCCMAVVIPAREEISAMGTGNWAQHVHRKWQRTWTGNAKKVAGGTFTWGVLLESPLATHACKVNFVAMHIKRHVYIE